jgi:hypothetical protein
VLRTLDILTAKGKEAKDNRQDNPGKKRADLRPCDDA